MTVDSPEAVIAPTPLVELADALRSDVLSLEDSVETALERIDGFEPGIRALLPEPGRRQRLLEEAKALRERFPDPALRPPLFGILVGVKDIINTDGFATRAGSMLPPELLGGPEAACVARLRSAGALILGKTVTTEFAYMDPGATANPNDRSRTPGGSSSGSAAAVAAGYAPLALGSQTVGSVIRPAAFCGVVGFKPSYGRIPTDGVLAFSRSVDCVGAFARNASGIARAASVLCDAWSEVPREGRLPTLGVPVGPYLELAKPEARRALEEQLERLASGGCQIRYLPALRDIEEVAGRHLRLIAKEFEQVHESWFREHGSVYRPASTMLMERASGYAEDSIEVGRASGESLRSELEALMDAHDLDAWACPAATGGAPQGLQSTGDAAMNLPWTHARLPAVSLPAGNSPDGLPLGLQLAARRGTDERLVAWAQQLEPLLASV